MPQPNPAAMEFLLNRRSRPAKTLQAPAPDRAALAPILTAAARSPDHGKLEPWRFIVLERAALDRLAALVGARGAALAMDGEQIAKAQAAFADSPLAVVVVAAPVASEKVPEIEQFYSAGAVCLALLNAALASGWGANWLSGWASHDRDFVEQGLGLSAGEHVAGILHIGTERAAPPERPRPDLTAKTTWMDT
ncbi:nitroreductase family protein [Marinovum sp. 2_MG-2023]|uniref:nitroreductase family protein n=1 Tax=unclassified Marinovum TaxID=2647166 RepID=UPI0026E4776A|nr:MULTISPECIES: nitroreductase family protein [unclassified Marinovum]MDO6730563.1 nitroreductase family protein [Marinovum sp. 2_MG-2023]MDO6778713.1 nitroreductase family protein [Marinovum sp. 1_MG-2023]